ncbi:ParB N-terminal domain-containing protein [Phytoactinopolyspora halotolerans]|uniref:ParB N-terminal domain-containing protein n=1 Tax=Phytoactinopolyspora halotolerans TaxID=1981512 RepID=A0A6L9S529_9ACTN|nr:ParB N-terminal domain-containing protein [Phytoactinopolyspora halotolerans]
MPLSALLPADSPRVSGVNEEHARALAQTEDALPPIVVHAPSMRVVDGMHRLRAAQLRGEHTVRVRLFHGDESAAFVLAVRANIAHGLPLSLADREAAARRIVELFPDWSNRAIAKVSGLSDKTVGNLRERSSAEDPRLNRRRGRDGRSRPVDASEARRLAGELLERDPGRSLRSVAHAVGLSPATVIDVRDKLRQGEDPAAAGRTRAVARPRPRAATSGMRTSETTRLHTLENLRRDPSLRMNDAGRDLLRWLEVHAKLPAKHETLVRSVPPHCAETLSVLARDCSAWWSRFAQQLELNRPDG